MAKTFIIVWNGKFTRNRGTEKLTARSAEDARAAFEKSFPYWRIESCVEA